MRPWAARRSAELDGAWQPNNSSDGCSLSVRILCKLRPAVEMAACVRLAPDIDFAVRAVLVKEVWGVNSTPVARVVMRLQAQRRSGDQRRIEF